MDADLLSADSVRPSQEMVRGVNKVDRYKWKVKDRKGSFAYITKGLLQFDHENYQRADISEAKVLAIAADWSWVACGCIIVARRRGVYYVMDGQYRTQAALRRADISDLPCLVFDVEDVKNEAQGFLDANAKRKPVTSRDKFKALITTENEHAVFVQELLTQSRRGISNSNNRSARCLSSLLTWARTHPDVLRRIWPTIDDVCGEHAIHVHIVDGLMSLEMRLLDNQSLADRRWRERLVSVGLDSLLDYAHKAQALFGKGARGGGKQFARGMLECINKGLRNKLSAQLEGPAACRAVAAARSFDEVREWEDKAAAVKEYARRIRNRSLEIDALEIRERAKHRRGELLLAMKAAKVLVSGPKELVTGDGPINRVTLADLDTTKNESSRDQALAKLGLDSFERLAARVRAHLEENPDAHSFDVLALQRDDEKQAKRDAEAAAYAERTSVGCNVTDLEMLASEGARFSVIYADPPWEFKVYSGKGKDRSADRHYNTGGLDAIKRLPVATLAAENCALLMWAVMPELPGALEVIKAWGFEYKTVGFTWIKQNKSGEGLFWGMGYWTRANAEVCLLATKGSPERQAKDVHQVLLSPVTEHSRKPDEFHGRIERLLRGPYLELYARRERDGWTTWGNEIPRDHFSPPTDANGGPLQFDADSGEIRESRDHKPQVTDDRTQDDSSLVNQTNIDPDEYLLDVPDFLRRQPQAAE